MNNFYVISNTDKDPGLQTASMIKEYLTGCGKTCECAGIQRSYGSQDMTTRVIENIPEETQCVLVLGGDGTIIQVAGALAKRKLPILGINLGNLGYLAEIDTEQITPTLERLIEDKFDLENRMMLIGEPTIAGDVKPKELALNDIVITRNGPLRVLRYRIYVNDKLLNTYEADGIIVSTPTGSTGYSMSAGGPIVEPDSQVLLVTPISAHTLNSRAIVLSPADVLRIEIAPDKNGVIQNAQVCFDGGKYYEMHNTDSVTIARADVATTVIKMSKESFLNVLARKISS